MPGPSMGIKFYRPRGEDFFTVTTASFQRAAERADDRKAANEMYKWVRDSRAFFNEMRSRALSGDGQAIEYLLYLTTVSASILEVRGRLDQIEERLTKLEKYLNFRV